MSEEQLRRVSQQRHLLEDKGREQRYQDASRKRMLRILQKKVTTAFIGALSKVETYLGTRLWGHGTPEDECSMEELAWREIWEQCRTEILNTGNNQVRAVEAEINEYTVNWNRYQTVLPAKGA